MRWKKLLSWGPTAVACSRSMFSSSISTATRCSDRCRIHIQSSVVSSNSHLDPFLRNLSTATTRHERGGSKRGDDVDLDLFEEDQTEGDDGEGCWSDDDWDDAEHQVGDGGDGGGVVLRGVEWGGHALSIANHILKLHFDTEDMKIFAFKVSPKGYIYVRLDKVSQKYGCPSMDEIEHFNRLYKDKLEESGKRREIPENLAIEISSPGASRLLVVPSELERFKDIPLVMNYSEEDAESHVLQKREGVFILDSMDINAGDCTWKLADVKENKDSLRKGSPMSKKQKEWRLTLPFKMIERLTFHLSY